MKSAFTMAFLAVALTVSTNAAGATVLPDDQWTAALKSVPDAKVSEKALGPLKLTYVALKGGRSGYVFPNELDYGNLESGRDLLIVPLEGARNGASSALIFTGVKDGAPKLLGAIKSDAGHLRAYIERGQLHAVRPVYAKGDKTCCPSTERTTVYKIDGTRLIVDVEMTAHFKY
jgi:hypothetical protein